MQDWHFALREATRKGVPFSGCMLGRSSWIICEPIRKGRKKEELEALCSRDFSIGLFPSNVIVDTEGNFKRSVDATYLDFSCRGKALNRVEIAGRGDPMKRGHAADPDYSNI